MLHTTYHLKAASATPPHLRKTEESTVDLPVYYYITIIL